jgi:hypothetical protein
VEWATIVQAVIYVLRALQWPLEVDLASWCARAERLSLARVFDHHTETRVTECCNVTTPKSHRPLLNSLRSQTPRYHFQLCLTSVKCRKTLENNPVLFWFRFMEGGGNLDLGDPRGLFVRTHRAHTDVKEGIHGVLNVVFCAVLLCECKFVVVCGVGELVGAHVQSQKKK